MPVRTTPALDGLKVRLSEAARAWDAEVENARRLEARSNILITVSLAVAGFAGKAVLDAILDHPTHWPVQALLTGACLGIVLVFWGFAGVVVEQALRTRDKARAPERASTFASARLLAVPPDDDREWALWLSPANALKAALLNLTSAALDLHRRNGRRRKRVQRAQLIIVCGIGLTLLAGGLYAGYREAGVKGRAPVAQGQRNP